MRSPSVSAWQMPNGLGVGSGCSFVVVSVRDIAADEQRSSQLEAGLYKFSGVSTVRR